MYGWNHHATGSAYFQADNANATDSRIPVYDTDYNPVNEYQASFLENVVVSAPGSQSLDLDSFPVGANQFQTSQNSLSPRFDGDGPYYQCVDRHVYHDEVPGANLNMDGYDQDYYPQTLGIEPTFNSNTGCHDWMPSTESNMNYDETDYLSWLSNINMNANAHTNGAMSAKISNATLHQVQIASAPLARLGSPTMDIDKTATTSQPTCPTCHKVFRRLADLARHAGVHDPAKRTHRCPVQYCIYRPSYRKDKLVNHMKKRHAGFGGF